MKVAEFSLYMLKKEKKKSFFYILSSTFSVAVMFLFLNIIYNESYAGVRQIGDFNKVFSIMLSFLVIAVVVAMSFFAYKFYLSSQTKEIGIYMLGGSSLLRLFWYLFVQNCLIYLIAIIFGLLAGSIMVPLVNLMMGKLMEKPIPLLSYSSVALYGTLGLTIVSLVYLAIVSTGFIHRHEIKELIGMKTEMKKKDERILNFPPLLYAFLFLIPIPACIYLHDAQMSAVFAFVAVIFGFKGFCRYVIPNGILKWQRKRGIEKKVGLISSGNFHQLLVQCCSALQIFLVICIFMNAYLINHFGNPGNIGLIFVAYLCLVISISMGLGYTMMLSVASRQVTFQHIHRLGYTKLEIKKMIRQEILAIFGLTACILLFYISALYFPEIQSGSLPIGFACLNMSIFIIALLLTGFLSYRSYLNTMMKEIR